MPEDGSMEGVQIMGQERINRITKILLDIMFYSGLVVFVTLPWSLKMAGKYYSENYAKHYFAMLLIFAAAGLCAAAMGTVGICLF